MLVTLSDIMINLQKQEKIKKSPLQHVLQNGLYYCHR